MNKKAIYQCGAMIQ